MTHSHQVKCAPDASAMAVVDSMAFKNALGHYASGITIITSHDEQGPIGFTCQSFHSLSVDPPLISFSVMNTSSSYPRMHKSGRFAVNVLSHAQASVSNQFAMKGTDKWKGIAWESSGLGNPLIRDSLIWLDCTLHSEYEVGDHHLIIGKVHAVHLDETVQDSPLLYFKGQYRELHT